MLSPDLVNSSTAGGAFPGPLTSIAERRAGSGEDSEDEEEEEAGGWKTADTRVKTHGSVEEGVIKAGYLWKKGERRKVRSPSSGPLVILTFQVTDMEETMVCVAACTPSLL
jgi:hypothetical protein